MWGGHQNIMTDTEKHLKMNNSKYLPSTLSSPLIWNLPCVTMSAVLEVVVIISACVFYLMEWIKQRCTCLFCLWGVAYSPSLYHYVSSHTHKHTKRVPTGNLKQRAQPASMGLLYWKALSSPLVHSHCVLAFCHVCDTWWVQVMNKE